jgi:phospholipid transport system substrate-binding protein
MKRLFVMTLLLFTSLATLSAGAAAADPEQVVKSLYHDWLTAVKAKRDVIAKDKDVLYELTDRAAEPYVDFDRLARLVLGQHWRDATPAQRQRFVEEFRKNLVRTYATVMERYLDADFRFLPLKYAADERQVVVRTVTIPADGSPQFPVNYVLYRDNGTWKALDVSIEGVSVVATLRNVVSTEIQRKSLDGVIEEIERKNEGESR